MINMSKIGFNCLQVMQVKLLSVNHFQVVFQPTLMYKVKI